jgi:hypothetical protein
LSFCKLPTPTRAHTSVAHAAWERHARHSEPSCVTNMEISWVAVPPALSQAPRNSRPQQLKKRARDVKKGGSGACGDVT